MYAHIWLHTYAHIRLHMSAHTLLHAVPAASSATASLDENVGGGGGGGGGGGEEEDEVSKGTPKNTDGEGEWFALGVVGMGVVMVVYSDKGYLHIGNK